MTIANNTADTVVLERIQKLIALTTSPNLNEAANAAAKVQEVLDAHNLNMSQVTAPRPAPPASDTDSPSSAATTLTVPQDPR